jgi:ribosomal protein L37AE/L43A
MSKRKKTKCPLIATNEKEAAMNADSFLHICESCKKMRPAEELLDGDGIWHCPECA